jgi:hypothetical protein
MWSLITLIQVLASVKLNTVMSLVFTLVYLSGVNGRRNTDSVPRNRKAS